MFVAIILAAGRSTRMGRAKGMLPHTTPHTTFVAYLIRSVRAGGVASVCVVGRPDDLPLRMESEREGARFVPNPHAEAGQLSSLLAGLAAAAVDPAVEGILVTPVDVPFVTSSVVERLLRAAGAADAAIIRAAHAGRHGHPVVFKRRIFEQLRNADPSIGAKAVLRNNPGQVLDVEMDDPGVTQDIDTPADYERIFGRKLQS